MGVLGRLTPPPHPQLLGGRARGAAMLAVFLVSAVVHEYIFCFVLGFFYPVMLILFLVIGGELGLCATGLCVPLQPEGGARSPAPGDSTLGRRGAWEQGGGSRDVGEDFWLQRSI